MTTSTPHPMPENEPKQQPQKTPHQRKSVGQSQSQSQGKKPASQQVSLLSFFKPAAGSSQQQQRPPSQPSSSSAAVAAVYRGSQGSQATPLPLAAHGRRVDSAYSAGRGAPHLRSSPARDIYPTPAEADLLPRETQSEDRPFLESQPLGSGTGKRAGPGSGAHGALGRHQILIGGKGQARGEVADSSDAGFGPSSSIFGGRGGFQSSEANMVVDDEDEEEEDLEIPKPAKRARKIAADSDDDFVDPTSVSEIHELADSSDDEEEEEDVSGKGKGKARRRKTSVSIPATAPARQKSTSMASFMHALSGRTPSASASAATARGRMAGSSQDTPVAGGGAPRKSLSDLHWTSELERKKEKMDRFNLGNKKKYCWLDDVRDKDGKPAADPEYNPRTVLIPPQFWEEATPFEKQYWEIKKDHFDTVVFFKKGKFFELFERDADLGNREFDLKITDRGYMRMVGVPEASFEYWASKFVAAGHRVAKVDQMETALGSQMRRRDSSMGGKGNANANEDEDCGAAAAEDGIAGNGKTGIRRELTQVLTSGTLIDGDLLTNDLSTFCLALKEEGEHNFGVCFADTSTAQFNLVSIAEDTDHAQLETLLMQIKPREIIAEKGNLSASVVRLIKGSLGVKPLWNVLTPRVEFWDAEYTLDVLGARDYFPSKRLPAAVEEMRGFPLVVSALGGMVSYLESVKLASTLLPMQNFRVYSPMENSAYLVLDGQTLRNLEIFGNQTDDTEAGSLWAVLNHCKTGMGKRLLKKWVMHPLNRPSEIAERTQLIAAWEADGALHDVRAEFGAFAKRLPDLERSVSRIFTGTSKLREFLLILEAFKDLNSYITKKLQPRLGGGTDVEGRLYSLLFGFPSRIVEEELAYFKGAFDHGLARSEGVLIPQRGVIEEFDRVEQQVADTRAELEAYRREQQRELGFPIEYRDLGKELFLMEVPASKAKKVPADWKRCRSTKNTDRYYSDAVERLVQDFKEGMETRSQVLSDIRSRMYRKFSEAYKSWSVAIAVLAELDCAASLAVAGEIMAVSGGGNGFGETTRAVFVDGGETDAAVLDIRDMRHPSLGTENYVPNDTLLGGGPESCKMILLTGPNAGGKSTLLRQTCLAVILAHIGCKIPASSVRLTTVDRIFTRIGANDNILAGQSTFMVELAETAKVLTSATSRSLVILDELGRGTSTFDGYAIAWAVLAWLVREIGCLGLFSTHYGMLTEEYKQMGGEQGANPAAAASSKLVSLMHMACIVDDDKRDVTFLYKLQPGVCSKSYGMNVANMAGIPREIVDNAERAAQRFEETHRLQQTEKLKRTGLAGVGAGAGARLSSLQRESVGYLWSLSASASAGTAKPSSLERLRRGIKSTLF